MVAKHICVESKWGEARYWGDTSREYPGEFNVDSYMSRERERGWNDGREEIFTIWMRLFNLDSEQHYVWD